MEENCYNCKFNDNFMFCEKLVIDTLWRIVDGKRIKAYYIDKREKNDCRSSFITPENFKCKFYKRK